MIDIWLYFRSLIWGKRRFQLDPYARGEPVHKACHFVYAKAILKTWTRSKVKLSYPIFGDKKRGGFTSAYKIQLFNLSKFWSACRTYISSICVINHNSTLLLFSFLLFSIVVIDLMTVISVVSFNWYDSIGSDPPNRCHALPYLIMNQGIKVKCYSFKKANPVYGKLNLSRLFI